MSIELVSCGCASIFNCRQHLSIATTTLILHTNGWVRCLRMLLLSLRNSTGRILLMHCGSSLALLLGPIQWICRQLTVVVLFVLDVDCCANLLLRPLGGGSLYIVCVALVQSLVEVCGTIALGSSIAKS